MDITKRSSFAALNAKSFRGRASSSAPSSAIPTPSCAPARRVAASSSSPPTSSFARSTVSSRSPRADFPSLRALETRLAARFATFPSKPHIFIDVTPRVRPRASPRRTPARASTDALRRERRASRTTSRSTSRHRARCAPRRASVARSRATRGSAARDTRATRGRDRRRRREARARRGR